MKRNWLLPVLFLAIIGPGIMLCVLGIILTARQRPAEAAALKEQYQLRLENIAGRIDNAITGLEVGALAAARAQGFTGAGPTVIEPVIRQLAARYPIIRYPFLIDGQQRYRFPFPASVKAAEAALLDEEPGPPQARALIRQAESLEQQTGRTWDSLKIYLRSGQLVGPGSGQAWLNLAIGRCYLKLDKFPQALSYFEQARDLLNSGPAPVSSLYLLALNQVALCHRRQGQTPEAIAWYLALYDAIAGIAPQDRSGLVDALKSRAADFLKDQLGNTPLSRSDARRPAQIEVPVEELFPTHGLFLDRAGAAALAAFPTGSAAAEENRQREMKKLQDLYGLLSDKTDFYERLPINLLFRSDNRGGSLEALELPADSGNFPFRVVYILLPGESRQVFGFTPDSETIRRSVLSRESAFSPGDGQPRLAVIDSAGQPISGDLGPDVHVLLERPLQHAPAGWRLSLFAASPRYFVETAEHTSRWQMGVVVILIVTLGFGLFLFARDYYREARLIRLKTEFFNQASHTLKTPLTRIQLLAEKLQLGWVPGEDRQREYYARIKEQIQEMTAMINGLLDFARLEETRFALRLEPAEAGELVQEVLRGWRDQLESQGFILEVQLDPVCPRLLLDRAAIITCLVCLITNAVNYSAGDKFIRIEVGRKAGSVVLTVSDHGVGIEPAEQAMIFSKFYRGRQQGPRHTAGSGLGLYIVKSVAEAHGGSVAVTSTPGKGSCFTLHLPIRKIQYKSTQ